MKQLKKHSIGFNSVSSIDGVINARGVKSKPNNLEVFGYTNEVGEGEKSPDNPYQLVSLDSGNVNLYNEDKIVSYVVNSETGVVRLGIKLSTPKSGYYCVRWDGDNVSRGISYKLVNQITGKTGTYNIFYVNSLIEVPHEYDIIFYDASGTGDQKYAFINRINLMILDSPIMPDEYITDEHSIVLSNNDTTIQVPAPISLNSVEGVSDYIYKDRDGDWKLTQLCEKYKFDSNEEFSLYGNSNYKVFYVVNLFTLYKKTNQKICASNCYTGIENKSSASSLFSCDNFSICFRDFENYYDRLYIRDDRFSTVEEFVSFLAEQYKNGIPVTVIYQLETPIVHILSDYAQQLLNSFVLQNKNEIWVEGYPDIKISGYLQKR